MSEQEEFTEHDDARARIHQVSHIQPENPDIHEISSSATELYTVPCTNLNEGRTSAKRMMVERDSPPLEKKKKTVGSEDEAFEHFGDQLSSGPGNVINLPDDQLFGPEAHQSNIHPGFMSQTQRKRKLSEDDSIFPHLEHTTVTRSALKKHERRMTGAEVREHLGDDNESESEGSEADSDIGASDPKQKSLVPYGVDESSRKAKKRKQKGKKINKPSPWKDPPQGLKGKDHEMTTIIFHALLPTALWEFDASSSVYLRFGSPHLGEWQCDVGPMQKISSSTDEIVKFRLEVKMKSLVLSSGGVPYKYCVYTPKTLHGSKDAQYEYIYNIPGAIANRYLTTRERNKPNHQYDTLIYPPSLTESSQEKKGFFTTIINSISTIFLSGKSEASGADTGVRLPSLDEIGVVCFKLYLSDHLDRLKSGSISNPLVIAHDIASVYNCLSFQRIYTGTRFPQCLNLTVGLGDLLIDFMKSMAPVGSEEGTSSLSRQMTVAMIVVVSLDDLMLFNLSNDVVIALLQYFKIVPDLELKECKGLEAFLEYFSQNEELKLKFLRGLKHCIPAFKSHHDHLDLLFSLVALYHFIDGHCIPFGSPQKNPRLITWPAQSAGSQNSLFKDITTIVKQSNTNFKKFYVDLEALFIIDPLLLPSFIFMIPVPLYKSMFDTLPLFYCIARLGHLCDSPKGTDLKDLQSCLTTIHSRIDEPDDKRPEEETKQLLDAAVYVTEVLSLRQKLNKLTEPHVSVFTSLLSLVLKTLSNHMDTSSDDASSLLSKTFEKQNEIIKAWIKGTIGGSMFGNEINTSFMGNSSLKKPKEELDEDEHSSECLRKLMMSENAEHLFDNTLTRRYSKKDFSIDDVLGWEAWPFFFKIFVKQQRALLANDRGLSGRDLEICNVAVEIFSSVCLSVIDGTVAVNVLCKLQRKKPELMKLCDAVKPLSNFSVDDVIVKLNGHLHQWECFKELKAQLSTVYQQLSATELVIPDLSILDKDLTMDVSMSPISSLCHLEGNTIVYNHFQCAASLFHILPHFTLLVKSHPTKTFGKFWQSRVAELKEKGALKFQDVTDNIWKVVFDKTSQYLDSLKDRSIPLVLVDQLLTDHSANRNRLETEFKALEEGISKCKGLTSNSSWIENCIQRILEYFSLLKQAAAAKIFLKLRTVLSLKGDFKVVEELADNFKASIHGQTLQYIDDNLAKTGEFLHGISSDLRKLECLRAFTECQKLVQWIKVETTDVHDLQHFVTIALATAAGGEDDLTRDKLSNLRTVGSGFAKLIYRLPLTTGCMELVGRCKSLWDSLSHDPSLPEKLIECSKQIEWYKSVKETQGSVEKSSFGQMYNIKRYGYYTVGSSSEATYSKASEVIKMDLKQEHKSLARYKYTMDELRDLESKLVLITGRKSEEKNDVDHFLKVFNSVCHIAEVLIQLQQYGHSKYLRWVLKLPCNETDLVDKLMNVLKGMINDLDEWKKKVGKAREHFYSLNYYTTQQLLLLRKELSLYVNPDYNSDLRPDVLSLLQCLSRDITQEQVISHIRDTDGQDEDKEMIPASNLVPQHMEEISSIEEDNGVTPIATIRQSPISAPQPKLGENDLTIKQRMILDNLIMSYGFHNKLILLAFERSAEPEIEEEVEKWCSQHQDEFDFIDEGENKESYWPLEEEWDNQEVHVGDSDGRPIEGRVAVNENHPIVQQLLLAGYSLEQSYTALDQNPSSTQEAMEFIDQLEETNQRGEVEDDYWYFDERYTGALDGHTGVTELQIESNVSTTKPYLSLKELAQLLNHLSTKCIAPIVSERNFGETLKQGEPNLLIVPPDEVLKTVLMLYMKNEELPLPTYEEVLICTENTTAEEVTLLWRRAVEDPNHLRIFCLVHAQLLSYQVCDTALRSLTQYSQGRTGYKLVIVCSNEDQEKSHIIAKLQMYNRTCSKVLSKDKFSQYLMNHFTKWPKSCSDDILLASAVDPKSSYVRVVTSSRAGMGKSLYIQRMKEELSAKKPSNNISDVVIPVHGPKVTFDSVVQSLKQPFEQHDSNQAILFHLDVAPNVLSQVDSVLFSLLILQALSDSQGRIWRCHPSHLYAIEATVFKNDTVKSTLALFDILPSIECISPRIIWHILERGLKIINVKMMDKKEFCSEPFQRVYQYLTRHMNSVVLDNFSYVPTVEGNHLDCLKVFLKYCGVKNPSWSELKHFIDFLNTQLQSCEKSIFTNEDFVRDVMSGLKTFVVKFMIRMSKDFATSSLTGEVVAENEETRDDKWQLKDYQIDVRKQWEQCYHPYLFFNEDGMSITFVGFNVSHNGDIYDPLKNTVIEAGVMTPQLHTGLRANMVNLSENYQSWGKDVMIAKIGMVMGLEWSCDPDPTYVLTVDNVIKIMAIHMRLRCNIPVILMGETGCGKTRLIRFMCDLAAQGCKQGGQHVNNMLIMKIHGGTTESDVVRKVKEAESIAVQNRALYGINTVLFFDEANTSDAIGLIKEVMCDRRINGRQIKGDVKFIAACNPYKRHSDEMINKLKSAGLGFFVEVTQQKLGKIPLRELVYRVLDLPPSMRPLVYDFGQLSNDTEKEYTAQIVKDRCQRIPGVMNEANVIQSVANVLAWSQAYMRKMNDECGFVSLRDVERAMIVFDYFCSKDQFHRRVCQKANKEGEVPVNEITRSLILSVSVCYHARLYKRDRYERHVVKQFVPPLAVNGTVQFLNEIRWCQDVLLDNMKLGPNIARNAALRENVFMMAICIELRIPLFLVGKPGSSKSLAKSIVADSMLGRSSESDLMREFKEVHMFSYQCSQLSTPESVIEVFNTAKSFQKKQDVTNYVSVVVLDEVGLAEDSPNLPLKALHPLLEDGTEGADDSEQFVDREQRVAFIGISNWALDPAKMNRGVMVTRGDPDIEELIMSARGICSNDKDDPVKDKLKVCFKPLASAYKEICEEQKRCQRPFFGLRDFYSLIKMLYWMCKKSGMQLTGPQLQHAIKRNFGGLDLEDIDTYSIFKSHLKNLEHEPDLSLVTDKLLRDLLSPDCSPLGLIRKSLQTKETSWHGENRYLLFLTENYAALHVIRHYLNEEVGLRHVQRQDTSKTQEKTSDVNQRMEPFVLFGSSFPKDREYTQVCRNINQIKICMETGRTVILLNLENLYESLYDLLNQYYIHLGGQRYVDLGLQTHRVKCRVHKNFKLILIAEKATVYKKFPTPLINRLEKHFVLSETVLLDWQKDVLANLCKWIEEFSDISIESKFSKQDAFVGYQNDTPASVVFQATEQLTEEWGWPNDDHDSHVWKKAVLARSKKLLLMMSPPDALIRLKYTPLNEKREKLNRIYYFEQHHSSLVEFIHHHLQSNTSFGVLIQVTTHSHLLSSVEADELSNCLQIDHSNIFLLQEFDTEMDFSHKINPSFSNQEDSLLIIQCDSGHLYSDLLACARYRIDDEREKKRLRTSSGHTHVLFIINLPRQTNTNSSFVGFQGGSWISAHVDDIRAPSESALTLNDAHSVPISALFYSGVFTSRHEAMETNEHENQGPSIEGSTTEANGLDTDKEEDMIVEEDGNQESRFEDEGDQDMSDVNTVLYDVDPGFEEYDLEELPVDNERDEMDDDLREQIHSCTMSPDTNNKDHSQCSRLYNNIQAAVAILAESGAKRQFSFVLRVQILLKLIPRNPKFPIADDTFYGGLVKHIKKLLEEGEEHLLNKEWVLNEAMSGKKLQSGGTFQNVLTRKLDEVIVPIFTAILSFIDQYSNLSLIYESSEYVKKLWLLIFSNEGLVQFSYQNFMMGKGIDAGYKKGQALASDDEFSCQFPFFWLVKECIETTWEAFKSSSGEHRQELHSRLIEVLSNNPLASVLQIMPEEQWNTLYQYYMLDVLKSMHHVPHHRATDEYEILRKSLNAIVTGPDFSPHNSLLSLLLAVHVVYHEYEQEIMWFGQLTSHIPGILILLLQDEDYNCHDFDLPLLTVMLFIGPDNLALPLVPHQRKNIPERLVKLQLCQNSIDTILTLGSTRASLSDLTHKIRLNWQIVKAIQLFIEHVAIKCSLNDEKFNIFVQYAKRIDIILKSSDLPSDFTKRETILKVQRVLRVLDKDVEKKLKYATNMQKKVRECCESYFMEVVSSLCFGQLNPPEPDLIKELLNVVFTDQQKTREFTYSERQRNDSVPVIRSFLLQLLLEYNTDQVKEHLIDYFSRAKQLIRNDRGLCLLCVQCLEDAIYKQHHHLPPQAKTEKILQLLEKGQDLVKLVGTVSSLGENMSMYYLEGVSILRYSMTVIAEIMFTNDKKIYTHHQLQFLMDMTKKCCCDPNINDNEAGPGVFLMKQIARQYGVSFLSSLTSDPSMQWIVPENLRLSKEEASQVVHDPFVIYKSYGNIKTVLTDAVYSEDLKQFNSIVENVPAADVVPLLVGVYQVVTGSVVLTYDAKRITDETKAQILTTIRQCDSLKRELKWFAQHLIQDTYYGILEPMMLRSGMSSRDRLLTDLIVHVAVSVQHCSNKLLTPFVQMINSPEKLKNSYLPTMPEDSLPIVRNAVGRGQFYECLKGHLYFVSECGRPVQEYTCPVCHCKIGGLKYKLEVANKAARTTDITETGYALGLPNQRETVLLTERSLTPSSCAVIRALMHCSLLWSSCTNEHATEGLLDLIKSKVRPAELSLFFWQHLQHDINLLSKAIGKSVDDAFLFMHLILQSISTINKPSNNVKLDQKELRDKWEKDFSETFINPILTNIGTKLNEATVLQLNEGKEDLNRLFFVIHERVNVPPTAVTPHLWSYHSRITLEHLSQVVSTQKETCPILHEFLKKEPLLRATQYLSAIVKLQQTMYHLSHRKLDKKEVAQISIGTYMNTSMLQKDLHYEMKRDQLYEKLKCLRKAWALVKERLKDHTRVPVDSDFLKTVTWDDDTPLSYLIPTLKGDGVCTVALVDLLVGLHNDFINMCYEHIKTVQKKITPQLKIPVSQIQSCHLLSYEEEILSLVISHSRYSLEHGKGQNINYDLPGIERHLLDRFVLGKPIIQLEIPQVVYRKDVYTAEAFANIRRNVYPQMQLSTKQQTDIISELGSMQRMRECLDVVEIVIGFLSSGKNNANMELKTYVKRVLRMEDRFVSKKVMEFCTLSHILSLWVTLSVQIGRNLTILGEEPFDSFSKDLLKCLQEDQKKDLMVYLKSIDIPPFLNLLYEFIETTAQLSESHNIQLGWSLRDTIYPHLQNYHLADTLPHHFSDRFPEEITVEQSIDTWKNIVLYLEKHEREIIK
uniref:RZ-type domain-containing protein n=1 Tax=Amphimedon queenslandica TaxID=400682 RepID=A0A1X7TWB5_AMPQE